MAGLLTVRLTLALVHPGYLGVDGGAYELHALRLLGLQLPQIDFTRPPLAPGWLLVPFLQWFGTDVGYKIWAALFSVLPLAPAFYLLARRFLSPHLALFALFFFTLNIYDWEMFVTGSLPLIGIAFILLAIWGITGVTRGQGTTWDKLAIIGSIALIPYINETSSGLAFVAIGTYLLALAIISKSLQPITKPLPFLILGALLATPALYWYRDVIPGGDRLSFPGPKIFFSLTNSFGFLTAALGWFFGGYLLLSIKHAPNNAHLKALTIVLLVHSSLTLFWSYDESIYNIFFRSANIASVLMVLIGTRFLAADWTQMHWSRRRMTTSVCVLALLLSACSMYTFYKQASYSDMITPNMNEARQIIPQGEPTYIITTNFMTGLWIAALNESPTYWAFSAEPPRMWQETYRSVQCILAWRTDCNPVEEAKKINAKYVLVDERFPHITKYEPNLWGAPDDTWAPTNVATWLQPLYSKGTVRLWEINQSEKE